MSRNPAHILIIEDEMAIAMDIERRLQKMGYIVDGIAVDAREGEQMAEELSPDLLLMDIQLGEKTGGLSLSKKMKEKGFTVVFLTAFGDRGTFAQALDTAPDGYVLKPFRDDDLQRTIEIALKKSEERQADEVFSEATPDAYFIREKGQLIRLAVDDLLWLEALDNYTRMHTAAKVYTVKLFLGDVLAKLPADRFVRVHRSFAIAVLKISLIEESTVYIGKHPVPIGRQYREELLRRLRVL